MSQNGNRAQDTATTMRRYDVLAQRKVHAITVCGRLRLTIAVGVGTCVWWAWTTDSVMASAGAAVGIALFFCVVVFQLRIDGALEQNRRRLSLAKTTTAQLSMDWSALPAYAGSDYPTHPYAHDLHIIGQCSLIQLLDHSITEGGHRQLLNLLLSSPASVENIRVRQGIVRQLARRRVFLVKLFCARGNSRIDDERVARSFTRTRVPANARTAAGALSFLAIVNGVLLLTFGAHAVFWAGVGTYVLSYTGYYLYAQLSTIFSQAVSTEQELRDIRDVFSLIEHRIDTGAPELAELCSPFQGDSHDRPSTVLNRLSREIAFLSVRSNSLVHIILNVLVPWDLLFALRYRRALENVEALWPTWVGRLSDLEAYACLAFYAHNRPHYCWPLLDDTRIFLEARGLGHPLIRDNAKVTNDISLSTDKPVSLLTGSNMSGKSVFLRTLGINACLANAGGAVCAESYRSSLLFVHCSISLSDCLAEGMSFFYSEALRLKNILSAAQNATPPGAVLALIDEIFKGTNNRERIIGSRCYLEAMSGLKCLGVVSTHDLEVAHFGQKKEIVINYHFREFVKNGGLVFDYKIRPGICRTTNALLIMRTLGIPVPNDEFVSDIDEEVSAPSLRNC